MKKKDFFSKFSQTIARWAGHPSSFVICLGILLTWGLLGPIFKWSDTWQLVINTATSVITFLMVFLIQSTQNRDSESLQLKLDELISVTKDARKTLLDLEELSEEEQDKIKAVFLKAAEKERSKKPEKTLK